MAHRMFVKAESRALESTNTKGGSHVDVEEVEEDRGMVGAKAHTGDVEEKEEEEEEEEEKEDAEEEDDEEEDEEEKEEEEEEEEEE